MKKPIRISFRVSIDKPPGATVEECRQYIWEAVMSWRGQLRPPGALVSVDPDAEGDPM